MRLLRPQRLPHAEEGFAEVLAAAQANEPWAFRHLHQSLAGPVAAYLRRQRAAEPDDLTSEVFLGAFRGLRDFQGDEDQFRSWIFTIAQRRLVDERRRLARRPPPDEFDPDAMTTGLVGNDVEQRALDRMGTARVDELLSGLAPDQRNVLLLRVVADLTVAQVADVLGKSPEAVKALQRRGLAALQRRLTPEGVPL